MNQKGSDFRKRIEYRTNNEGRTDSPLEERKKRRLRNHRKRLLKKISLRVAAVSMAIGTMIYGRKGNSTKDRFEKYTYT